MFKPFSKNENIDLKNVTNLDVTLDKLNNNQLFDLGYIVLFESLLAIRTLTSEIEDSYIWIKMITNATHNIPLKLKESDISFLKAIRKSKYHFLAKEKIIKKPNSLTCEIRFLTTIFNFN